MTKTELITELADLLQDKNIDKSTDLLKILDVDLLKQLYIFFELDYIESKKSKQKRLVK